MWRKKEKNGLFSKDVVMVCFSRDIGYGLLCMVDQALPWRGIYRQENMIEIVFFFFKSLIITSLL